MQREKRGHDDSSTSSYARGDLRGKISSIFGKSHSIGSFFGSKRPLSKETPADDLPRASKSTAPVIEELEKYEEGDTGSSDWTNRNPLVQHPEDQADDHNKIKNMRKTSSFGNIEGSQSISYRRVTYGGINGAYITATTSRLTGSDGRVWEETKHADTTTGEATHRVSRGIHDKGHTVTRKLKSDGKVDTMETLRNLEEEDLVGFERDWKGRAGKHMPQWNDGLDRAREYNGNNAGSISSWSTNWDSPFRECGSGGGLGPNLDAMVPTSRGRPKKVITINIE